MHQTHHLEIGKEDDISAVLLCNRVTSFWYTRERYFQLTNKMLS